MGEKLRVGVVGLGYAGGRHLAGYAELPDVEVIALAGLETDRLEKMATEHGIPHRYEHWEDLLARDDLDVVSVCTPTFLHAPIAIAALRGGRHVLCEKPLARSCAEAEQMVRAAREAGRVLDVVFNYRHRGDVEALRRYVEAGTLGRIYHAKASWLRRSGIPTIGSWFTNKEMAGGGPLIDIGVHILDLALYLLDEPRVQAVSAATYAELGPQGRGGSPFSSKQLVGSAYEVEDLATAFLRLEGGATLWLEASWATYTDAGDDMRIMLLGNEGGADMNVRNYSWEDTLRIYTDVAGNAAEIRPLLHRGEGHIGVVRDFVETVRGGDWSGHVGEAGLTRARVIDACYASAKESREITLG